MRLRPFAPLVVVGAGLLIMTAAPRPASAENAGAPTDVLVTSVGTDLLVTWQAPVDVTGLTDFDLTVTDPTTGSSLLERSVDAASTEARVATGELDGRTEFTITVVSEYGDGQRFPGGAVRVALPEGLPKPEAAPAVRVESGRLKVHLPKEDASDITGRVVRLFRDGDQWKDVTVPAGRSTIARKVTGGHAYSAAYQVVTEAAESPFSEQSDTVSLQSAATGPTAVKRVKLKSSDGGLQVRWSAAVPQGADLDSYRIRVSRDGERIASAYTDAEVRTILLADGRADDGAYSVTVTAQDAAGRTSSATSTLTPQD